MNSSKWISYVDALSRKFYPGRSSEQGKQRNHDGSYRDKQNWDEQTFNWKGTPMERLHQVKENTA
jgi:hypothetical protein